MPLKCPLKWGLTTKVLYRITDDILHCDVAQKEEADLNNHFSTGQAPAPLQRRAR